MTTERWDYFDKQKYDNKIGCILRKSYESGCVKTENEFKKELEYVLFGCLKSFAV